ncbi:hypothetical protein [Actinoplanes solisilvae]|uniref:hypothetical protein n=1 Tax=Actinoplanes solisilvae TaxID=2486853 RepID=UPI000FD8A09F|nr:hypothetical protein [Actinoplanes solisilvae]
MPAIAAGTFRRTPIERADQRVSWERSDQAFFSAGACHILAWACRDAYPNRSIILAAMVKPDEQHPLHVYATWGRWAFDASGWNSEEDLLAVNAEFEGGAIGRRTVTVGLEEFCTAHIHRRPEQFWRDPIPRARDYVRRFEPPWSRSVRVS